MTAPAPIDLSELDFDTAFGQLKGAWVRVAAVANERLDKALPHLKKGPVTHDMGQGHTFEQAARPLCLTWALNSGAIEVTGNLPPSVLRVTAEDIGWMGLNVSFQMQPFGIFDTDEKVGWPETPTHPETRLMLALVQEFGKLSSLMLGVNPYACRPTIEVVSSPYPPGRWIFTPEAAAENAKNGPFYGICVGQAAVGLIPGVPMRAVVGSQVSETQLREAWEGRGAMFEQAWFQYQALLAQDPNHAPLPKEPDYGFEGAPDLDVSSDSNMPSYLNN